MAHTSQPRIELSAPSSRNLIAPTLVIFLLLFAFAFGTLWFQGTRWVAIEEILRQLPEMLALSWPILLVMLIIIILIFGSMALTEPAYLKIEQGAVYTNTALARYFQKEPKRYPISKESDFNWIYRRKFHHWDVAIVLDVKVKNRKKRIFIRSRVFGYAGTEALLNWLAEHYPMQKRRDFMT